MLAQVHHPELLPDSNSGKVDDNFVPLAYALLVQGSEGHRVGQKVPIVRNLGHRHGVPQGVGNGNLEEARDAAAQNSETVLARLHLYVWLVGQVHSHHVAQEPVEVEDVEVELPVTVPSFI